MSEMRFLGLGDFSSHPSHRAHPFAVSPFEADGAARAVSCEMGEHVVAVLHRGDRGMQICATLRLHPHATRRACAR